MRTLTTLFAVILFLGLTASTGDKPAYKVFDQKGKHADYKDLLKAASDADIIFFGEVHDNSLCHWLELELAKDLYEVKKEQLVLGAEMFEADNQLLLNEYITRFIRKKDFEAEAKLWPNYRTDYAPLVDLAREKGIRFVGTNIPRRYAAIVNQKGFAGLDSINAYQRAMIAPLPIKYDSTLQCYASIGAAVGEGGMSHATMHLAEAQAIKDATMAHFILKNWENGKTFLHFNGSYHSDDFQGTVWYINTYGKRLPYIPRVLTITTVEQDTLDEVSKEYLGKADFIICIPSSMTKTR
jgi:uncharacterized iron-regulated protein